MTKHERLCADLYCQTLSSKWWLIRLIQLFYCFEVTAHQSFGLRNILLSERPHSATEMPSSISLERASCWWCPGRLYAKWPRHKRRSDTGPALGLRQNGKWQHPGAFGYVKSLGLDRVTTHGPSIYNPVSTNDGVLCRPSVQSQCWHLLFCRDFLHTSVSQSEEALLVVAYKQEKINS